MASAESPKPASSPSPGVGTEPASSSSHTPAAVPSIEFEGEHRMIAAPRSVFDAFKSEVDRSMGWDKTQ